MCNRTCSPRHGGKRSRTGLCLRRGARRCGPAASAQPGSASYPPSHSHYTTVHNMFVNIRGACNSRVCAVSHFTQERLDVYAAPATAASTPAFAFGGAPAASAPAGSAAPAAAVAPAFGFGASTQAAGTTPSATTTTAAPLFNLATPASAAPSAPLGMFLGRAQLVYSFIYQQVYLSTYLYICLPENG